MSSRCSPSDYFPVAPATHPPKKKKKKKTWPGNSLGVKTGAELPWAPGPSTSRRQTPPASQADSVGLEWDSGICILRNPSGILRPVIFGLGSQGRLPGGDNI